MVQYDISVYDANQKKLCTQLDTTYATEGEQSDVSISQEMSGWKELTFDIPWVVGREKNFRMDFLKNENTIRVIRNSDATGTYEDWFLIREPEDAHSGKTKELTVSCEHISSELKTKNLYVYFDDTNGIDTIGNLVSKALHGSGWTQGLCDTLYEADGTTEKVRSYSCDEKTGSYNMVTGICDLFMAYPTFNGADKTVDIHAISNKTGNMEFYYGKNMDSLHRSPNSTDIVTRLYVEGDYSDLGYVGIEDVNPTGLGYIMNFDYYKEVGAFTDTHQAALDTYIETAKQQKTQIETTSASMLDKETRLSELWGTGKYVLYSVSNGQATAQYLGNGAEQDDAAFKEDDLVVAVKNGGEYSYVTASAGMTFGTNIVYAVKFLTPSAGQIGGKEVAIEAKETTIETLTEAKEEAESEKEKTELQNQINTTQQEINNLKNGTTESEGSYALMWEAVTTVLEIKTLDAAVKSAQEDMAEAEQTFVDAMGNMLHDGYWNNSNYTVGQEESLYADAVEILKIMSRPAVTYSMSFLNLAALSDYKMEEIKLNMRVRIYDFELGVNDWGFIERIVEYPLAERENTVTISTDELNIGSNTFESVLNRMMEAANIIDQRNAIYERAAAISEGGTISADQLNGEIDLLKNHLASTKSGWYTDSNGNIMFEAQDGQSAMMLSGSGFMVANGKDASGNWNWRTFGTGEGFTADLITAGILRAGTITILGTDQFYWDADNIYIFDPSDPDRQIRIGKYDGANYGIGYTTDNGKTWQNAIGFDGVTLSASATETINSLGDRVTEVESKVTPDAIVQTVTESETYQNEIGGLDQRISTAESKLTPEAMETTIENSEALSEVRQTANKITWIIEGGTSSSNMTMTEDALSVISEGITLTADKINLVADDINLTGNTSVNTIVNNATDELQTQIQQNADNIFLVAGEAELAKPYISDTPPDAPIEKRKLWIDTGAEPDIWRFWRGADVPTKREFEAEFAQTGKNLVNIYAMEANYDDTTARAAAGRLRVATSGEGGAWRGAHTKPFLVYGGMTYTLSATLEAYTAGYARVGLRERESRSFVSGMSVVFGTSPGTLSVTFTPTATMNVFLSALCTDGTTLTGDCTFASIQLEKSSSATTYAEYEAAGFVALNNEDGQIRQAGATAGCRARQAGTGAPSPENIRAITGRESVEIKACGKNLFDPGSLYASAANMDVSRDSVRIYTTGDGGTWRGARTPAFAIHAGTTYALSATLDKYVSGDARIGLRGAEDNTFLSGATLPFGSGTGSLSATFTPDADDEVYLSLLCTNGTVTGGDCTFSNIQLEIGGAATAYEPYRSMGGGTVTPTEPLYGLPGAEDTVEVSVDGDVLVTHRTAIVEVDGAGKSAVASTMPCADGAYAYVTGATGALQMEDFPALCSHFAVVSKNAPASQKVAGTMMAGLTSSGVPNIWFFSDQPTVEAFNAWLAVQSDAGTAVALVYAMAAPEAEALTAVAPIAPQPGQVNILTDADALTATIYGSGWETVNDTGDLRDGLDDAQSDISSMLGSINTMRDNISSMASQILSPDEIVSTVTESNEWQSQTMQITQNGEGLALVQTTVSDLGGRMDTMEGVIVIDPPNIDIGVSGSNTKLHLDNEGWDILSGGSATISARENKVVAPRFQVVDALMIGGLAFRMSNGHLYLLKNGG